MADADRDTFPTDVLVCDDEEIVRQVLTRLAGDIGLSAHVAASGEQAVELAQTQRFACLLVDKNLPGIDGLAVMRRVLAAQPHCAAMMITGYASTESAIEALRAGAVDYLEKPLADIDLVAQKIVRAIEQKQVQHDRDQLLARLRALEGELDERRADDKRDEVELFNSLLEQRVQQATADLNAELETLRATLRESGSIHDALAARTRQLVASIDEAWKQTHDASSRGLLTRLKRQLVANLALMKAGGPAEV